MRRKGEDSFRRHKQVAEDAEGGDMQISIMTGERRSMCYYISCSCLCDSQIQLSQLFKDIFNLYGKSNIEYTTSMYFDKVPYTIFEDVISQLMQDDDDSKKNRMQFQLMELPADATHKFISDFLTLQVDSGVLSKENLVKYHKFRQRVADIFGLADVDNDNKIYWHSQEMQEFWQVISKISKKTKKGLKDQQLKDFDAWISDGLTSLMICTFHDLSKFLWIGQEKFNIKIEHICNMFYKKRVCCSFLCCICKKVRQKLTASRVNQKDSLTVHYSAMKVIMKASTHFMQLLNKFLILTLGYEMYFIGQEEYKQNGEFINHYHIGYTIVVMAFLGPYVIQYSSMINAIYQKGYFQKDRYNSLNALKKLYFLTIFTCIGPIIMIIIEFNAKFQNYLNLIFLMFRCKYKENQTFSRYMHVKMERWFEDVFNLNTFELEGFEKQYVQTSLIFEKVIILVLDIFVYANVLSMPQIKNVNKTGSVLFYQTAMTLLKFVNSLLMLAIESQGLNETFIEYLMLSVKAKLDWVPFGNQIEQRKISKDIDYNFIQFKIPYLTDMLGYYKSIEYQFTEESLNKLSALLDVAYSQHEEDTIQLQKEIFNQNLAIYNDGQLNYELLIQDMPVRMSNIEEYSKKFIPKIKFGISLQSISLHAFLTFINKQYERDSEYVFNYLDLGEIDWHAMILNSQSKKLNLIEPTTNGGKPLLQVCIENEHSSGKWQLQKLMKILLEDQNCNPNIFEQKNQFTLLTYCYNNKKHKAFKMLIESCKVSININKTNKIDHTTIYGILFQHCVLPHYKDNDFQPNEKLNQLLSKYSELVNKHMSQIRDQAQEGILFTPIYWYVKKQYDNESKTIQELINSEQFQLYFGSNEFTVKEADEINQLLSLQVGNSQKIADLSKQFINEVNQNLGDLDQLLGQSDQFGNNLLHLTDCKFSEKFWQILFANNSKVLMDNMVKNHLKNKNKQDQTPISRMLKLHPNKAPPVKAIQRLFDNDWIDLEMQDTFEGIENEIIEGFFHRSVNNFKDPKNNQKFIDKHKFFKAFKDGKAIYIKKKQHYQDQQHHHVFEKYFLIDEYEQNYQMHKASTSTIGIQNKLQQLKYNQYEQTTIKKVQTDDSSMVDLNLSRQISKILSCDNLKKERYLLEPILVGSIEISAAIDLVSDLYIVIQLAQTSHNQWFTLMLYTMLCPYYTVYTSYINYLIQWTREKVKKGKIDCSHILNRFIFILPTMIIIMIVVDILFIAVYFVLYLAMILILIFTCRSNIFEKIESISNQLFQKIFHMSSMEVRGFRSQRTIQQLMLESLPQIILQLWILSHIRANDQSFTIKSRDIFVSLIFACLHLILEAINLYLEAHVSETQYRNYLVACYNARQDWFPQQQDLLKDQSEAILKHYDQTYGQQHSKQVLKKIESLNELFNDFQMFSDKKQRKIQFDNKSKKICCLGNFQVEFELSNNSIEYLFNIVSNMPYIQKDSHMQLKTIRLEKCIEQVSTDKILKLLELAYNKINVEFDEQVLLSIMKRDDEFLNMIRYPYQSNNPIESEHILVQMVKMEYLQVVKQMLILKANLDIKSKDAWSIKPGQVIPANTHLFDIAYHTQNNQIISLIMIFKSEQGHDQVISNQFKDEEIFYNEIVAGFRNGQYVTCPLLLLDPEMLIPWDMQHSSIFNMNKNIKLYPEQIKQRWDLMFAAHIFDSDYQGNVDYIPLIEQIVKWMEEYPKRLTLAEGNEVKKKQISIQTSFLSQFATIRKALHVSREIDGKIHSKPIINLDETLRQIDCSLEDIVNVYQIHTGQLESLNKEQMLRCDKIVKKMGFDKEWSIYYNNSRRIQTDCKQSELIKKIEMTTSEFEFEIPENIQAIKEIQICIKSIESEPVFIDFRFDMAHCKGNIESGLQQRDLFQSINFDEDANQGGIIFLVNEDISDYKLIKDYRFQRIAQVIKNSIQGGHTIKIKILDSQKKPIECIFNLELFLSIIN